MKKNGFTLIELLVVIVLLAGVMVLTTPKILKVMNESKKSIFILFSQRVIEKTQEHYYIDQNDASLPSSSVYVYDIKEDLDLQNVADYKGFVVIDATGEKEQYYLTLYDNNYMLLNFNITSLGFPSKSSKDIMKYDNKKIVKTRYDACLEVWNNRDTNPKCYTMKGRLIQPNY